MTPEQKKAAKIQREIDGRGIWRNAKETELLIARALRAERNAALKEAAVVARGRVAGSIFEALNGTCLRPVRPDEIAALIRSLKSPARRSKR